MRLALAAVAAVTLFAAACGGSENEPSLAQAAERTEAAGSYRLGLTATIAEPRGKLDIRCEGAVDHTRKRARVTCDEAAGGFEQVAIDGTTYLRAVSGSEKWTRHEDSDDPLGELAPERLLALLRSASVQSERAGEEEIRGEPTTKYRLIVNCDEAELQCPATTPVEVWIDDAGLVRRIWLADGPATGTLEFFDFGAPVDIEPPPADQVVELKDASAPSCSDEEARPIAAGRAVRVLRRHGFDVGRSGIGCSASVAASLSNFPLDGIGSDAVRGEQGLLFCSVLVRPGDAVAVTVATILSGVDRPPVERSAHNVQCSLFTDESSSDAHVERLDAAIGELKHAIRP